MRRHSSRCRPKPFACDVCHSGFGRKQDLDHHKRTVRCGGPPQPEPAPKRQKVTHLREDPLTSPPVEHANDELSAELRDFVHENWASVRTHVVNGPVQTRYNHRLTSLDTRDLQEPLFALFDQQKTAFKVNASYGFVLKEKQSGRLRYYLSSSNCCGRLLEEPSLIANRGDFDRFLARIAKSDIQQWARDQRPDSDWVCEHVTNVTFFINRIAQHPIGCVGVALPDYVKNNKAVVGLEKDHHRNAIYRDNLCLFRCLGLHLGREAAALLAEYTDTPVRDFAGVPIQDLHKIEAKFEVNVCVYKLVETLEEKTTAELVRRSECHYPHTMYMNLYETHYSYIHDIGMYCQSYRCRKCGDSLWKTQQHLLRHERTCDAGINRVYKGGVYRPSPSIFQRLDDEGIVVDEALRYYPYRATFDFECYFTGDNIPADTDHVQWSARHVPLSVSVASNVPGYEPALCFVTDGDADKHVLDNLKEQASVWDEVAATAHDDDENGKKTVNPYKTLEPQLQAWLHQLPVIGFNSSKYDLNAIKRFFVPLLIRNSDVEQASCFAIKRQNTFMCLSTDKLKFVDICNYLAPGFSYDKYLKA